MFFFKLKKKSKWIIFLIKLNFPFYLIKKTEKGFKEHEWKDINALKE